MPKRSHKIIIFFILLFAMLSAHAQGLPLPADQAFRFSASVSKPGELFLQWQIAPGYYLYHDKFQLQAQQGKIGSIDWPATISKTDPLRNAPYLAYQGLIKIAVPFKPTGGPIRLKVHYQGCSEDGFCYAPIDKLVKISFSTGKEGASKTALLTVRDADPLATQALVKKGLLNNQDASEAFLSSHYFFITLLGFLGLGLLLAFTPCSLPMIPILSSIIVGQQKITTRRAFNLSLAYVLGTASTYALAGLVITWLGISVQTYMQNIWVLSLFSLLFVLLAASMLDLFQLRAPQALQRRITAWQQGQQGGTYFSVFLMGALSTLVVSPCVTAPLVGVLAYVTHSGDLLLGTAALFALGLGMGLPLLLIGTSAGKYLPKSGAWMETIKKLFAFLLLGMAVWMLSRALPEGLVLFLWASWALLMGFYLFFFSGEAGPKWRYGSYLAAVLLTFYAFVLYVGVATGQTQPFYLFTNKAAETSPATHAPFVVLNSMDQLDTILAQAKAAEQPVMLDFYASWCESCQAMEAAIFNHPEMQEQLGRFVLLRADVTANNAFDKELMRRFQVIAPPAVLFFDAHGEEIPQQRIVGELDRQQFLARVVQV